MLQRSCDKRACSARTLQRILSPWSFPATLVADGRSIQLPTVLVYMKPQDDRSCCASLCLRYSGCVSQPAGHRVGHCCRRGLVRHPQASGRIRVTGLQHRSAPLLSSACRYAVSMASHMRHVWSLALQLVRLDIRQSSDRIVSALDAVTRHLGLGSYSQWDEADRQVRPVYNAFGALYGSWVAARA